MTEEWVLFRIVVDENERMIKHLEEIDTQAYEEFVAWDEEFMMSCNWGETFANRDTSRMNGFDVAMMIRKKLRSIIHNSV